jgi:hypothetical protein
MFFKYTNEWFPSNLLSRNFGKTHFMQFLTKHSSCSVMNINYNNKIILNISATKFLGLITDNILPWKSHMDTIAPKLNQAYYKVRVFIMGYPRDDLLCLLSIYYDLWDNILGKFRTQL